MNTMFTMKKGMFLGLLAGAMLLMGSCAKNNDSPSNNNNNNNNNNTNPLAPKIGLGYYKKNYQPLDYVQLNVGAKAVAPGATVSTISRTDGMLDSTVLNLDSQDSASDIYFLPKNFTSGTINLKYTVKDSKGNTASVTATITVGGSASIFGVYKKEYIGDEIADVSLPNWYNTGGFGTKKTPIGYLSGDVNSDTTKRRLVDLACAEAQGGGPALICAPSDPYLDGVATYSHMDLWTTAQRNKTLFKKLPDNFDVTTFKSQADIKAKYEAITDAPVTIVKSPFSPSNAYVFLTRDGRYGAFLVTGIGTNGVEFTLAVQSR